MMLFLFQTTPILMTDIPFNGKNIFKMCLARFKKGTKERDGLGLPGLKLYFASFCLIWMKDWVTLRNRRLLEMEGLF